MVDFAIEPARTALVIIDLQNCFVEGSPVSAPEGPLVLERLNRLAEVCRARGIRVIHTAHVVRADGSNTGVMGEIIPPVRQGIINEGSATAAFHQGLKIEAGDIVVRKPRFGAFHGTDLELILRSNGIDTLIIGGIATNVCCETTAREANVRDFRVLFLRDATATFGLPDLGMGPMTAAEVQKATCSTLALAFAQVLSVEETIGKISSAVAA